MFDAKKKNVNVDMSKNKKHMCKHHVSSYLTLLENVHTLTQYKRVTWFLIVNDINRSNQEVNEIVCEV